LARRFSGSANYIAANSRTSIEDGAIGGALLDYRE
jgi:hypothetical protein